MTNKNHYEPKYTETMTCLIKYKLHKSWAKCIDLSSPNQQAVSTCNTTTIIYHLELHTWKNNLF